MDSIEIFVEEEYLERLDLFIASRLDELSRSEIQKLIKNKQVLVNNRPEKTSYKVKKNDRILIDLPREEGFELIAEDLKIEVVYEDDYIAVVNKPYGMVVHPGAGNESGTLVNGLLYRFDKLGNADDPIRPGIVHRLDKDTSGLLVIAKDDLAYERLVESFKARDITRAYNALVYGRIKNESSSIRGDIGRHPVNRQKMAVVAKNGKPALTHYSLLESFENYSYIEARLETGRTHQIRVHFNHINHPIVGDQLYSSGKNEFGLKRQFLHSAKIEFSHPITGEVMEFNSGLPEDLEEILVKLRRREPSERESFDFR